jgi:hypothetical protein
MRYPKRSQYEYAESRYQVRNWADYEAGLQRRGALTVWLSDAAVEAWRAPATGRPGGQPTYSDLAIEAPLTIRMIFRLPLRQTKGSSGRWPVSSGWASGSPITRPSPDAFRGSGPSH